MNARPNRAMALLTAVGIILLTHSLLFGRSVSKYATRSAALGAEPELRTLDSIERLREVFEQDPGTPRLVLLLSPT